MRRCMCVIGEKLPHATRTKGVLFPSCSARSRCDGKVYSEKEGCGVETFEETIVVLGERGGGGKETRCTAIELGES